MSDKSGSRQYTRRQVLERGAALGLAAGSSGGLARVAEAAVRAAGTTPKRGGTLRVALIGGSASTDTLDPNSDAGSPELGQAARQLIYSKLTDMNPDGIYVPQLAESIESNNSATVWQIKLKKGVTFQDGQELTVDDVIWSYKRVLNPKDATLTTARGSIGMVDPQGIRKIDKYTMTVKLLYPWADMRSAFGQRFLSIIKNGAKAPFTVQNSVGTGAFKLTSWTPGTHYAYMANRNYFEHGKPYLDGLDIVGIPDSAARVNALIAGQVDCICAVPSAEVPALKAAGRAIITEKAGLWHPIAMYTNTAPFNDPRVRQALKLLIDRGQGISSALSGYGQLGNDLFAIHDPLYDSSIPQRAYDPEKARSLLKAAGMLDTKYTLYASDAVTDSIPLALVFAQNAKKAGVTINLRTVPAGTFFSTTYGHVPFTFSSWGYRPFFTQWQESFVVYDSVETRWNDATGTKAKRLVKAAAATTDVAKQKPLTAEAQRLLWDDGGYIIPYWLKAIDASTSRVHGIEPHVFPYLSWYRMWNFWLD